MKEIYYDKLVRDKIPEIIEGNGKHCDFHYCRNNAELYEYLLNKIKEETDEIHETNYIDNKIKFDEFIKEIADIYEVLNELCELYHITQNDVDNIRRIKKEQNGGFDKRVILERVVTNED